MIRARLSNGMFILGLDAENVRRLTGGEPIFVSLGQLGGKDEVVIMYGPTLDDVRAQLAKANGGTLPPEQPLPKGH